MQKKDLSLEGLRGMASLSVVLAHSLFVYFPYLTSLERFPSWVNRPGIPKFGLI